MFNSNLLFVNCLWWFCWKSCNRLGIFICLCFLLDILNVICFWCNIIVWFLYFSVCFIEWVIIKVVSFCFWIILLVSCIIKLVVFGLSVVVCLFSKRMFEGWSEVINRFMVCCWLFDKCFIWLVKWFFKFKFNRVNFLWKILCCWCLMVNEKLCFCLCW